MITWLEQHLFKCTIKSTFGIDCPGCGSQRALISLLKGNIAESISYHAALIPFIITIFLLLIQLIKKHPNGGTWVMWSFIITSAITLIQYFTKQIMLYF
jgi:hypothetical protein